MVEGPGLAPVASGDPAADRGPPTTLEAWRSYVHTLYEGADADAEGIGDDEELCRILARPEPRDPACQRFTVRRPACSASRCLPQPHLPALRVLRADQSACVGDQSAELFFTNGSTAAPVVLTRVFGLRGVLAGCDARVRRAR